MKRTAIGLILALGSAGCSAIVSSEVGKGIGDSCSSDEDCQGSQCVGGLCTLTCRAEADCPPPSMCTSANMCELPLRVGLIYVGVVEDEGWTLTHEEGRQHAVANLSYLDTDFVTNVFLPDAALDEADKFVADGREVIVANSFSLRDPMITASEKHPNTKFLTCSGNVRTPNLGTFFGRMEQAYHLAGFAAAQKTTTRRLGFLGSFITPEVVRHVNAFTRGAHRIDPGIVVEIRWEGFWFDTDDPINGEYNETVLTRALIEAGADVIAHNMDNGRALTLVEETGTGPTGAPLWAIGNDNQGACVRGPNTCLGTSYWNWGPMYVQLFDQIHRGQWDPSEVINENIKPNPDESTVNFGVNVPVAGNDLAIAVGELKADLAGEGNERKAFEVFPGEGQYCSTGQRSACVQEGEVISDEELISMCWFVQGVVEKQNPDAEDLLAEPDAPARVPQPECDTQQ